MTSSLGSKIRCWKDLSLGDEENTSCDEFSGEMFHPFRTRVEVEIFCWLDCPRFSEADMQAQFEASKLKLGNPRPRFVGRKSGWLFISNIFRVRLLPLCDLF